MGKEKSGSPTSYKGKRTKLGCLVKKGRRDLPMRRDLRDHSCEYDWGYSGSGPAQLALAILADYLNDDHLVAAIYQDFKFVFIANLDRDASWELTEERLAELLKPILSGRMKAWTAWTFGTVVQVAPTNEAPGHHVVTPLWEGDAVDRDHAIKLARDRVAFNIETMTLVS